MLATRKFASIRVNCHRFRGRYLATAPTAPPTNSYVDDFNKAIVNYPTTAAFIFMGSRFLSWSLLVTIFTHTINIGSPELAAAYLLTKATGKFRQPANVALAGVLSSAFPILSQIKASALLGIVKAPTNITTRKDEAPNEFVQKIEKFTDWLHGPIDKYGFALFLAGKGNILLSICGSAVAIRYGVNLPELLNGWGISTTLQEGAGNMAAATLANLIFLPAHLIMLKPAVYITVTLQRYFHRPV